MKTTLEIIERAISEFKTVGIAYSGGADSTVLLDIIYRHTPHRPPVVFVNSKMEYPETENFVADVCKKYNAELFVATPKREPLEQWRRSGWPMLGKLSARLWSRGHKDAGFKCDVSACCRNMKIAPGRKMFKKLGLKLQFTGQRGGQDDRLRGLREIKDGSIHTPKADGLAICNPLLGWTDTMIRRYQERHQLPKHPAKSRGAVTIGCVYCGGGAQFTISNYRLLRKTWPEAWRRFIVEYRGGEIILAIKYDEPLEMIREAINLAGGLEYLADSRPWIFDFLRFSPLQGYSK